MCIGIQLPVISSFSFRLSRRFYAIFLFLFPFPTTSPLCMPLTTLPLNGVRRSFDWSGLVRQLLPLLQLHPHPLPPLLRAEWHLRTSCHSFSAWMLALTLSVMSYVRWIPMLAALLDARLRWVVIPCLPLLWPLRMRVMLMMILLLLMMRMMAMLAHPAMTRCLLETLTLCHSWQKGRIVLVMRVVILRGRVSIRDFHEGESAHWGM